MKVKEYMLVFFIIKVSDYATNAVVRTKTIDMTLGKQCYQICAIMPSVPTCVSSIIIRHVVTIIIRHVVTMIVLAFYLFTYL